MGYVFPSVLGLELELEGKSNSITKNVHICQTFWINEIFEVLLVFGKILFLPSNSNSSSSLASTYFQPDVWYVLLSKDIQIIS